MARRTSSFSRRWRRLLTVTTPYGERDNMGRAAAIKRQRRELRRELERQLHDPRRHREVEEAMAAMRAECYDIVARRVDGALRGVDGVGDVRRARVWQYVKARAIWDGYFERGLPLEEICPHREAQGA